jgi:hypothetical protein
MTRYVGRHDHLNHIASPTIHEPFLRVNVLGSITRALTKRLGEYGTVVENSSLLRAEEYPVICPSMVRTIVKHVAGFPSRSSSAWKCSPLSMKNDPVIMTIVSFRSSRFGETV